jgi:hypothetical protein
MHPVCHFDFMLRVSLRIEGYDNPRRIPGCGSVHLIPHRAESMLLRHAAELSLDIPNVLWYHSRKGMS